MNLQRERRKSLYNLRLPVSVWWIHFVLNTQFMNTDVALPKRNGYYLKPSNNDGDSAPKQNLH